MGVLSINELKARFAAGDRPSAKDFSDFVDTVKSWVDDVNVESPGAALFYTNAVSLLVDTYTASYTPAVIAIQDGTILAFRADAINPSGGTKLDPGTGAKSIVRESLISLKAGDIRPGQIVEVRYDLAHTVWQMISATAHPGLRSGDIVTSAFLLEEDGTRFLCDGQSVDTNTYPTLAALSTTYGTPSPNDGHHVKLPDYRARFPLGVGTLPDTSTVVVLGAKAGEETHSLTYQESGVPAHDHHFSIPGDAMTDTQNTLTIQGDGSTPQNFTTGANTPADAADAHNNMPPWIAAYFYILI